jgi:hypothetical protein
MASTSRRSGNKLFGAKSRIINEWFRALLLCWVLLLCSVFIVYQTKLSKSTELFDLSELSASHEPELRRTPLLVPLRNWGRLCVCSEYLGRTGMRYPQGWPYFSSS